MISPSAASGVPPAGPSSGPSPAPPAAAGTGRRVLHCPRCSGDLLYDRCDKDWHCLQCGYVDAPPPIDPHIPDADERRRKEYICTIEGCDKDIQNSDLCSTHLSRLRRHGDPNWQPPERKQGGTVEGRAKYRAYHELFFRRSA